MRKLGGRIFLATVVVSASALLLSTGHGQEKTEKDQLIEQLKKEIASLKGETKQEAKITYYWTEKGIHTSDGRFFELKRENITDKEGHPLIILEGRAETEPEQTLDRSKMSVDEIMADFWLRIQDQELKTLAFVPSKFDNQGDLRRSFVTVTPEEADFLKIDSKLRMNINAPGYHKILVPVWALLQKQIEAQDVPIDDKYKKKVKDLRDTEIPQARDE